MFYLIKLQNIRERLGFPMFLFWCSEEIVIKYNIGMNKVQYFYFVYF